MKRFFPCKVLVVVDGSEEAALAAEAAVEISTQTGSDLHVAAGGCVKAFHAAPELAWEQGAWAAIENEARTEAGRVLGEQVKRSGEARSRAQGNALPGRKVP